jgi:hypothetical protein
MMGPQEPKLGDGARHFGDEVRAPYSGPSADCGSANQRY